MDKSVHYLNTNPTSYCNIICFAVYRYCKCLREHVTTTSILFDYPTTFYVSPSCLKCSFPLAHKITYIFNQNAKTVRGCHFKFLILHNQSSVNPQMFASLLFCDLRKATWSTETKREP